ncbi:hypothetical protein C2845_PM15G05000 [Panicum miliaceum]|uniref:Uncharacterized protein n=1 Tax=Panicum miliaceum TaxID=4540 RepID=A0A3L6Q6P1_PANMI|nr:hypothetical protein C2845_PM15G05000 [Panicum miliaceum]
MVSPDGVPAKHFLAADRRRLWHLYRSELQRPKHKETMMDRWEKLEESYKKPGNDKIKDNK